ncbi:MAG TPA: hypothetical protein VFT50_01135 [Baekduia sp.]|nr:hypothetical protein [Baekduia sp.]
MTPGRRALALLVVLAAGTGLGACGSSSGPAAPAPARSTTTRTTAVPPTAITITAPKPGTTVRGARRGGGHQEVAVRVAGTAAQQEIVRVDGHCSARSCARMALADLTGRWHARLQLVLPARARRGSITVRYALADGAGPVARLRVGVHPPARRAPAGRTSTSAASGAEQEGGAGSGSSAAPLPAPSGSGSGTAAASPPATSPGHGSVVVVGDSLAVGMETALPAALPGWSVSIDGRTGRPLAEGMQVLAATTLPPSAVLAMSLFTNDDPTHVDALRAAVQQTLARVGPDGCVVWATIQRPPLNGHSYAAANALLARLAAADPRLRLVPWAEAMRAHPELLLGDGVHPGPQGFALRAQLYAQAIASC